MAGGRRQMVTSGPMDGLLLREVVDWDFRGIRESGKAGKIGSGRRQQRVMRPENPERERAGPADGNGNWERRSA